jgi:NAD(P)-dependent dehydrogenase (short-subunit alcohol dehydrogenase family)
MLSLSGKGVLVTGAGGDIGAAIARAFLTKGAKVHITDIDAASLTRRTEELGGLGALSSSLCDLADPLQVATLADNAASALGQVDVLINNAAIQAQGGLEACSLELFDLAHAINVRAPFLLAKALVPAMRAVGGGAIVNITSVHASTPGPKRIAYATSKSAVLGLTRSLAVDLGPDNIRVNAVAPGATMTSQLVSAWTRLTGDGPDVMEYAKAQHPLRRLVQPDDIAEAVLYLSTATSATGVELRVDGGLLSALRLLP